MTAYPLTVYDNGVQLLQASGTFWTEVFADRAKLQTFFRGYGLEAGQTYRWHKEALDLLSRYTTPLYHEEEWFYWQFNVEEVGVIYPEYGDGGEYTYGPDGYRYGEPIQVKHWTIPLPPGLCAASALTDLAREPNVCYVVGVDCFLHVEKERIELAFDPLNPDNGLRTKRVLDTDGNVVATYAEVWIRKASFDLHWLYEHWGYVLDIPGKTGEQYKRLLNASFDGLVTTPVLHNLRQLVAAISGSPVAIYDETVELIIQEPERLLIITNMSVYEYAATATPLVGQGDTVRQGDALVDAAVISEGVDAWKQLPGISLGTDRLGGGYNNELTFENKRVPVTHAGYDDNGKLRARFEISGTAEDIQRFWEQADAFGTSSGKTLAEWLSGKDDPAPGDLPASINPLEFVFSIIGRNMFVLTLKPDKFTDDALGLDYLSFIDRFLQPQTTYVAYLELQLAPEYIDPDNPGTHEELAEIDLAEPVAEPSLGPGAGVTEVAVIVRS